MVRATVARKMRISGRMSRTGVHTVPLPLCMNSYTEPRTSGSTLNAIQLLRRTDRAVTTCHLPQLHCGAWTYPKDPAYLSTTLVYEVTTLASPGLPPFGWTSKSLEQARKHNEPISIPGSSGLTISLEYLKNIKSND